MITSKEILERDERRYAIWTYGTPFSGMSREKVEAFVRTKTYTLTRDFDIVGKVIKLSGLEDLD